MNGMEPDYTPARLVKRARCTHALLSTGKFLCHRKSMGAEYKTLSKSDDNAEITCADCKAKLNSYRYRVYKNGKKWYLHFRDMRWGMDSEDQANRAAEFLNEKGRAPDKEMTCKADMI